MLTTTAVELDEELVNRALVLTVDEGRDADARHPPAAARAAHARGAARSSAAKAELLALHRNAQRLLEPVHVVNPYAPQLTFRGCADAHAARPREVSHADRCRRAPPPAPARPEDRRRAAAQPLTYIEVTREDIAVANRLAARGARALARRAAAADAALPRAPRVRGSRARVRAPTPTQDFRFLAAHGARRHRVGASRWGPSRASSVELEYVVVHRAPRGQG